MTKFEAVVRDETIDIEGLTFNLIEDMRLSPVCMLCHDKSQDIQTIYIFKKRNEIYLNGEIPKGYNVQAMSKVYLCKDCLNRLKQMNSSDKAIQKSHLNEKAV